MALKAFHAHCSLIHNSQDVEATYVPMDKWMDKGNVVYTHRGILFDFRKQRKPAICYNMDESGRSYTKWNKPDTERQTLHDTTEMRDLSQTQRSREWNGGRQGLGGGVVGSISLRPWSPTPWPGLGTGPHSRRWAASKREKLHLTLPITRITAWTITPAPWKIVFHETGP